MGLREEDDVSLCWIGHEAVPAYPMRGRKLRERVHGRIQQLIPESGEMNEHRANAKATRPAPRLDKSPRLEPLQAVRTGPFVAEAKTAFPLGNRPGHACSAPHAREAVCILDADPHACAGQVHSSHPNRLARLMIFRCPILAGDRA